MTTTRVYCTGLLTRALLAAKLDEGSVITDIIRNGHIGGDVAYFREGTAGEIADCRRRLMAVAQGETVVIQDATSERDQRQRRCEAWVRTTFGDPSMSIDERVARFVEEALELAQACGMPIDAVERLAAHVYGKPPGSPRQEVGGCGLGLLGIGAALGQSVDEAERQELERIERMPVEHFRTRHNLKADAGVALRCDP